MSIIIGHFKPSRQGGWEGTIRTLTIDCKVKLVPNDDRMSDAAPAYRLMLGWQRIGHAWDECTKGDDSRPYLRLRFDYPSFPQPVQAALFPDADGNSAQFVWNRTFS